MNIADHFQDLTWTETTVQVEVEFKGPPPRTETMAWPRLLGQSADGKTALELIGGPDNIRSIGLLGQMSAKDMEATRRNGAYAAVCLAIIAPQWKGRDQWLIKQMKQLATTRSASIIQNGWRILLTFDVRTNWFNLKASH